MTYQTYVTEAGEIVVPAELTRALGMMPGDQLVMDADGASIVVKTFAEIVREGQRAYRAMIKQPYTVDEFIAERRQEAAAE